MVLVGSGGSLCRWVGSLMLPARKRAGANRGTCSTKLSNIAHLICSMYIPVRLFRAV